MIFGKSSGNIGVAAFTERSNEQLFLQFSGHFFNMVKYSKEEHVLLILDLDETHQSLGAVEKEFQRQHYDGNNSTPHLT